MYIVSNTKKFNNALNIEYEIITSAEFISIISASNPNGDNIIIENKKITDQVKFTKQVQFNTNVVLKQCHFNSGVQFNGCVIPFWFQMFNCTSDGTIDFVSGNYNFIKIEDFRGAQVQIQGGDFSGKFFLSLINLDSIDIWDGFFKEGLHICNGVNKGQTASIEILQFHLEGIKKLGNIFVDSIKIDNIFFFGQLKDSDIIFNRVAIKSILFQFFINTCRIIFSNINTTSQNGIIKAESSDLGRCEFVGSDFSDYKIVLDNSIITEIKALNIIWPKLITSEPLDFAKNQENYRQLKQAMLSQGNKLQALIFEKDELNSYYKSLTWKKNCFDKFILATNWTNNQGHSWFRPLILLLISNLLFYITIKVLLGYNKFDLSILVYDVGRYIALMNPVHSTNIIYPDIKSQDFAFLLDSAYRIISAYLIFQLIMGFRKFFNKK